MPPTKEQGLMERLGGWGGVGELAGASLLGFGGNMLGSYLGGSISEALGMTEKVSDPMDMVDDMLSKKNEALVNTNAMGQRGRQASIGAKIAQDSFRPDTGAVFDKAQAGGLADSMLSSAQQQNRSARQVQAQQAGNMQGQMMEAASQSGGSPAAMMAIARQGGEAASQGAAGLLGQMGANTQQALGGAANTRQGASQIFNNALSQQYQRDVVPYMNDYKDMSSLAMSGLNAGMQKYQGQTQSNAQTKEGMSIDPLGYLNSAMGQSLGMQSTERNLGGGMSDQLTNNITDPSAGFDAKIQQKYNALPAQAKLGLPFDVFRKGFKAPQSQSYGGYTQQQYNNMTPQMQMGLSYNLFNNNL